MIENPGGRAIWTGTPLSKLFDVERVYENAADQCRRGRVDEEGAPIKKRANFSGDFDADDLLKYVNVQDIILGLLDNATPLVEGRDRRYILIDFAGNYFETFADASAIAISHPWSYRGHLRDASAASKRQRRARGRRAAYAIQHDVLLRIQRQLHRWAWDLLQPQVPRQLQKSNSRTMRKTSRIRRPSERRSPTLLRGPKPKRRRPKTGATPRTSSTGPAYPKKTLRRR